MTNDEIIKALEEIKAKTIIHNEYIRNLEAENAALKQELIRIKGEIK